MTAEKNSLGKLDTQRIRTISTCGYYHLLTFWRARYKVELHRREETQRQRRGALRKVERAAIPQVAAKADLKAKIKSNDRRITQLELWLGAVAVRIRQLKG